MCTGFLQTVNQHNRLSEAKAAKHLKLSMKGNTLVYDLRTIQIPKIVDDVHFETLCCDIWRNNKRFEHVNLNGRSGQSQNGVDVYAREVKSGEWIGIQCKARKTNYCITKEEIITEIEKAQKFNPTLSTYILCTTLDRDARLQEVEREINDGLRINNSFNFVIMFWDDLEALLKDETNISVYMKYYQKYFVDNTTLGHSIGKLMDLDLGVDGKTDTHYEVIVGKIPNFKDNKHTNANYYRGTYYIINWHEKRIETFPLPCHQSDLDAAFSNHFDRFRIAKWINSIEDIDAFIFDDVNAVRANITMEERLKYVATFSDDADT